MSLPMAGATVFISFALIGVTLPAGAAGATTGSPKSVPVTTDTSGPWHANSLHLRELHERGHDGTGATIAILDGGFDPTHPSLAGQVDEHFAVLDGKVKPRRLDRSAADDGHGTHVASIAAGRASTSRDTIGVAPGARLIIGNVLTGFGDDLDNIIAGLDHVAGRADVVNMSLGVERDWVPAADRKKLCNAVEAAHQAGTVVVVAAGNERLVANPAMLPGGCALAVTVSAIDANLQAAAFTSFDQTVDVAAPGHEIVAASADGTLPGPLAGISGGAVAYSGTSMAAPVVAGTIALAVQADSQAGPDRLVQLVMDTAADRGTAGYDPLYGHGVVQPGQALGYDDLPVQPTPVPSLVFNVYDPSQAGAYTRDGMLRWNIEPPRTGKRPDIYTFTWHGWTGKGDGSVTTMQVTADRVRGAFPVDDPYGQLTIDVTVDGRTYTAGPYPVLPHDEYAPVLTGLDVTWKPGARLEARWSLRRPLRKEQGEGLYTYAWFSNPHTLNPPVLFPDELLWRKGQTSGNSRLRLWVDDKRHERAWRHWYAGGHTLTVRICSNLSPLQNSCQQVQVAPNGRGSLPLNAHVARVSDTRATLHVQVNRYNRQLCRIRAAAGSVESCQGRIIRVEYAKRSYWVTLDATGAASVSVDVVGRHLARKIRVTDTTRPARGSIVTWAVDSVTGIN